MYGFDIFSDQTGPQVVQFGRKSTEPGRKTQCFWDDKY